MSCGYDGRSPGCLISRAVMIEPDESAIVKVHSGGASEGDRASGLVRARGGGAANLKEQGMRWALRISSAALSVQIGCPRCMPEFI